MTMTTAGPRTSSAADPPAVELTLPTELAAAARRLAGELPVAPAALLLAAHATVAVAMGEDETADQDPTSARADTSGTLVRCPVGDLVAEPGSWADLVRRAHDVLPDELHVDDIVCAGTSADGRAYRAQLGWHAGILRIHLAWVGAVDHRWSATHEVLSGDALARVAGYYRSALAQMTADPRAPHHRAVVLPPDETALLLDGLAGPVRELPDRRFHEILADNARRHPDTVAAVCGDSSLTYAELDRRVNQVCWMLVEHEAVPGDVVGVVTDRDLDWLTAVIGIMRAGACYLPIAPDLPAGRIAAMLTRAGCRTVLTGAGAGAGAVAGEAFAGTAPATAVPITAAFHGEDYPDTDPGVPVTGTDAAYIFFTSGTTGEPKGARCEHAGMLNHLLAKIEDLELAAGRAVAQTAPLSFDISLWQLLAPLVVGGRTVIVAQDVITDVPAFVDLIAAERVDVVQLVPSYLTELLAHAEGHTVDLPALRMVSATGEELPASLVGRWLARFPGIPLVNAYGLTETSDDTNHEVLRTPVDGASVPLGRPVRNVRIHLVDRHRRLVAFGAPGEIVFSGVCVGRDYINDPERTAAAFIEDPFRAGERAYLSGDYGRWLPDGRLAFLGRRDAQVKVHGFRIETGEIEHRMRGLPGVTQAAVVVVPAGDGDGDSALAGFYCGSEPGGESEVRAGLADHLPPYMIPRTLIRLAALPLTDNGKVDRTTLRALAHTSLAEAGPADPPASPTERTLAALWSELLGVPADQIGRSADFYGLGGTSLSAIRLAMRLERRVTPGQIAEHPRLTDLATLLDRG